MEGGMVWRKQSIASNRRREAADFVVLPAARIRQVARGENDDG
jgi:hypothetical protein